MTTQEPAEAVASTHDGRLLLPLSEVARRLGFSRSTIVRACDSGELPVVTFRGMRRIPSAFVDKVVAAAAAGVTVAIEDQAAAWDAPADQAGARSALPDFAAASVLRLTPDSGPAGCVST